MDKEEIKEGNFYWCESWKCLVLATNQRNTFEHSFAGIDLIENKFCSALNGFEGFLCSHFQPITKKKAMKFLQIELNKTIEQLQQKKAAKNGN